jgi:hypothetical protein
MIEYHFRVSSAAVFALYTYSKALEYRFRVPTASSLIDVHTAPTDAWGRQNWDPRIRDENMRAGMLVGLSPFLFSRADHTVRRGSGFAFCSVHAGREGLG